MQPETQLLGPTSGGWRFSKHRIIVFTWTPLTKGKRNRSRAGELRRTVSGAVPRWLKKFIIHDVSGSARERRGFSYISRTPSKDNEAPQIMTSCILKCGDSDWTQYARVRAVTIFKNGHYNSECHLRSLEVRPFLRGRGAINTEIICILLNGGRLSLELRAGRADWEMCCIPFSEALVHQHTSRPGWHGYELAVSYIRKNISVGARLQRNHRRNAAVQNKYI